MTGALLVVPRKFLLQHRASTTHAIRTLSSVVKQDGASSLPDHNSSDSNNRSLIPLSSAAKIEGNESQIATITLRPGETLRAESGSMLFMTSGVEMSTSLNSASSAFARFLTGQNLFLTDFTYNGTSGQGTVALGTDFPSKILRLSLEDHGGSLIAQRGAYLASNPSVDITAEFTKKFSTGFFGGQGFVLQRLSGEGDVLVKAGGTLVAMDLDDGQVLRVTSGSIVAFEPSVSYDIQMMTGVKNIMFGGEGLFVTTFCGPGKVWLQGMPPDRMIATVASRVPAGGLGVGPIIPLGGGGDSGTSGGETGADGVEGVGGVDSAEAGVAASDAAVEADRQATVATSGMMDDNYSDSTFSNSISDSESTDTMSSETSFTDDDTSFNPTNEQTFRDDTSFSDDGAFSQSTGQQSSQDLFGDDGNTDIFDTGGGTEEAAEAASEDAGSFLSTLWDFFMRDD